MRRERYAPSHLVAIAVSVLVLASVLLLAWTDQVAQDAPVVTVNTAGPAVPYEDGQ